YRPPGPVTEQSLFRRVCPRRRLQPVDGQMADHAMGSCGRFGRADRYTTDRTHLLVYHFKDKKTSPMEVIHLILGKANPMRMNGVNKVVHEMATNQVLRGYPVEVWGITANTTHDYPKRNFITRLFHRGINPFHVDKELKGALLEKK